MSMWKSFLVILIIGCLSLSEVGFLFSTSLTCAVCFVFSGSENRCEPEEAAAIDRALQVPPQLSQPLLRVCRARRSSAPRSGKCTCTRTYLIHKQQWDYY